jgi:CheY-like chemotaxis protein
MNILIADDEPVSRRILQGLLAKWGYTVVSVEDGNAAWELLKTSEAPRIVLLDWMMPGMSAGNCDGSVPHPTRTYCF